jgi:ABC-type uncharacterized transport system substrate-binding protein
MLETFKRLALGLILILLASAILLYTDVGSRESRKDTGGPIRVALVEHASTRVLEDGANGALEALAARGYVNGDRIKLSRFCAENDIATANTIAREVTSGSYDFILSMSTISLQTVAGANKTGAKTKHVFGLVSDPYGAGVGISRENHLEHPPYLTGYGCLQPVESIFRMARTMRPGLRRVGLVWNPAEANSVAQTTIARKVCSDLGIELIEANADNSTGAIEAAGSVLARGAEAIWISGDITVSTASEPIIAAAKKARIPVFSSLPLTIKSGALFDLGANYVEVGRAVGQLAADVLDGKDPATIPVENYVPEAFLYNATVLEGLRDRWTIPEAVRAKADGYITATETNLSRFAAAAALPKPRPGKVYKIGAAYFSTEENQENCLAGFLEGLRAAGFEEGKNIDLTRTHAQGEIANIPSMLKNLESSDRDLIFVMTTPVLGGACSLVKNKPVVFSAVTDPVAAGAGKSLDDHLPNVTGTGSFPPVQDMVDAIRQILPRAKKIGTIYNAAEANSVKVIDVARDIFRGAGFTLEEVTVTNSSEVGTAAQALVARGVDAIYTQTDNTVMQGFDAVIQVSRDAELPLFTDDPLAARRGALACVGLGFRQPGVVAGGMAARVLRGESPGSIPMLNVAENVIWLNDDAARKLGIVFPPELIARTAKEEKP